MRTRPVIAVVAMAALAVAGALSACSSKEPVAVTALTPSASASAEPSVNPVFVKAAKVYRQVLADPAPYLGLDAGVSAQEVTYTLDPLGDASTPRLVLQAMNLGQGQETIGVLRFISVQPEGDDVTVLDADYSVGVASGRGRFGGRWLVPPRARV